MGNTTREIITESLKGELQSVDFYLAIAEAAPNKEVKDFSQKFAAEEERHFQALVDWLEQDGDPTLRAALQEVRLLLGDPTRKAEVTKRWAEKYGLAQVSHPLRVLEVAIAKEVESIGYFQNLEKQVEDPLGRRVLLKILQDEEQHKLFLERRYQELTREGSSASS